MDTLQLIAGLTNATRQKERSALVWGLIAAWGLIACSSQVPASEEPHAHEAALSQAQGQDERLVAVAWPRISYSYQLDSQGPGPDPACDLCPDYTPAGAYECSSPLTGSLPLKQFQDKVAPRAGRVVEIQVQFEGTQNHATDPTVVQVGLNGFVGQGGQLLGELNLGAQTSVCGTCLAGPDQTITSDKPAGVPNYYYGNLNSLYISALSGEFCAESVKVFVYAEYPIAAVSPNSIVFDDTAVGSESPPKQVFITNNGGAPLEIRAPTATIGPFVIKSPSSLPVTILPGVTQIFQLVFKPTARTWASGALTIYTNDTEAPAKTVHLQGTGRLAVRAEPRSVDFGQVTKDTLSSPISVVLTNPSSEEITVQPVTTEGPFLIQGFTTAQKLPATSSISFQVLFKPEAEGSLTGAAVITSDADWNVERLPLRGEGVLARVELSPPSHSFGEQAVNTESGPTEITITNTGTGELSLGTLTPIGPFVVKVPPPVTKLAPRQSTTFQVAFAPLEAKAFTGGIDIATGLPSSPTRLQLSGTGIIPTTVLSLSPAAISFGTRAVGSANVRTVVLTNNGTEPVTLQAPVLSSSPPFFVTGLAPQTLARGARATFEVSFKPTSAGPESGVVTLVSNASGSPHTLTLEGTGVASELTLEPNSLSFGAQKVGVFSEPLTAVLVNKGEVPIDISAISLAPPFHIMPALPPAITLAPQEKRTLQVSFKPTVPGRAYGRLVITSNAASPTMELPVDGTGATVSLTLVPPVWDFGDTVAKATATQQVSLLNEGNTPLVLTGLVPTGPFAAPKLKLPLTLAARASEPVEVTFTPGSAGPVGGALAFYSSSLDAPVVLALSGRGLAGELTPSKRVVSFGDQLVGSASASQSVTLKNTGTAPLTISKASIFGDFQMSGLPEPLSLPVGAFHRFQISFKPTEDGLTPGALYLDSNDAHSPTVLQLEGRGTSVHAELETLSVNFGAQRVGAASAPRPVKLNNTGTAPLTLSGVEAAEPFHVAGELTAMRVPPGQSATVQVQFKPTEAGAARGKLTLTTDAPGEPFTVLLSGTGIPVTLRPTRLDFGRVQLGMESAPRAVVLTNEGSVPLQVAQAVSSSEAFRVDASAVEEPIAPGQSRLIAVRFRPVAKESAGGEVRLKLQGEDSDAFIVSVAGVGWDDLVEGGGYRCGATGQGPAWLSVLAGLALLARRARR